MGDDIETGRSTGSNYWVALRWLSENQNKRPDPNRCHHPLITQLTTDLKISLGWLQFLEVAPKLPTLIYMKRWLSSKLDTTDTKLKTSETAPSLKIIQFLVDLDCEQYWLDSFLIITTQEMPYLLWKVFNIISVHCLKNCKFELTL